MGVDFGNKFDIISKRMQLEFEEIRDAIPHPQEKGTSIEEVFRSKFLEKYFPKTLDISTGFIIDSNGSITKQLDVIISDAARTPIFYEDKGKRVIPAECVYAVIEVKTKLDSNELKNSFKNMKSVRNLEKKAYSIARPYHGFNVEKYGMRLKAPPTYYFIFALNSINPKKLTDAMIKKYNSENIPLNSRIDSCCILDKGVICNRDQEGLVDALPDPTTHLEYIPTNRALLLFYMLISYHLFQAQMPFFDPIEYLEKIRY